MIATYFIGTQKRYLVADGVSLSEEEWNSIVKKTARQDEEQGYKDRKAGFYDKWYRYNRQDDGAAYDRGCVRAVNEGKCIAECIIIECRGD